MSQKPNLTPEQKKSLRYLMILAVNTVLFFAVYRTLLFYTDLTQNPYASFVVFVLYGLLLVGFVLAYLIYNRFLYRKGLTPEQLPEDWSAEKKCAFLADGERRLERSKWMMTIIFPLLFTFLIDTLDLFILEPFFG